LTRPPDRHLDGDELDALVRSRTQGVSATGIPEGELRDALRHVESCQDCDRKLKQQQSLQNMIFLRARSGQVAGTSDCSDEMKWAAVAAGVLDESETRERMKHAAQCGHCGPLLKAAVKSLSDETTPEEEAELGKFSSARPEWQEQMARKLKDAVEPRRPRASARSFWKNLFYWPRPAFAAVALVVLIAAVWISVRVTHPPSVEEMLAQAYTERRTIEVRIPGANYAPLLQKRGTSPSSFEKPSILLKAEYQIKEQLNANPENPIALGAKGRAEILEWQYDDAIKSLNHARDLDPSSSSLLCDLATAYIQRADRGSNSASDYGQAIQYLGQVLQQEPDNKVALFNRAIAEERAQFFEEATKDWQKYLQIDSQSGWADEARQRLNNLQEKRIHGLSGLRAEPEPSHAIGILQSHVNHPSQEQSSWPTSLDEEYLDIAVTKWIPAFANIAEKSPQTTEESQELKALELLSRILLSNHHDRWLIDVLDSPRSQRTLSGWAQLAIATHLNAAGEFDEAVRASTRAEKLLSGPAPAAYLRSVWEHAYALQRSQQGGGCIATLSKADHRWELQNYPWLRAQIGLEHAICSAMIGKMRDTQQEVKGAISVAEAAHFETLLLRAYHIMGIQAASQDPVVAWQYFAKGLGVHWMGTYRPFRAYQFYAEMSLTPEARGQWQLARSLMEEAVTHIDRTPNLVMRAVAHQSLAVDAQLAGYPSEALSEFREATQLFSALPQTSSRDNLLFAAEVYQASLLSEQGQTEAALDAINKANKISSHDSQYWIWLNYYEALGEIQLRLGNIKLAENALNAAIYISEAALTNIKNETDRVLWERYTSRAYRALVELEFVDKHDPRAALETWEWYSAAPVRLNNRKTSQSGIDFTALEEKSPLPHPSLVEDAFVQLNHTTVFSVAQMNTGFLAWSFDERGMESARINATPEQVSRQIRRLLRLCSDPTSDVSAIRTSGRQLYDWFFGPFVSRLDPSRTLVFEPDGPLRDAPVAAFVTPQGQFLAETFAIVVSPGLGYSSRLRKSALFSRDDSFLAVAIPQAAAPFEDVRLPYLPDSEREAQEISSRFSQRRVLIGSQASLRAIDANLRDVRIFHFAGHSIKSSTRSGLLLAPASVDSEESRQESFLDSNEFAKMALQNLDLVVLSACATSDVEDEMGAPRGLVQTFFRAGVPEVIATQWDIDSHSTRELMNEFYEGLVSGLPSAQALRSAFKLVRIREHTSHPYYWASFVLFGASRD
jgi:CHAT domain-containing protein/cytochrome c-type biogenesis protein CcmH/NrfG